VRSGGDQGLRIAKLISEVKWNGQHIGSYFDAKGNVPKEKDIERGKNGGPYLVSTYSFDIEKIRGGRKKGREARAAVKAWGKSGSPSKKDLRARRKGVQLGIRQATLMRSRRRKRKKGIVKRLPNS